jgi:hypothetical protein
VTAPIPRRLSDHETSIAHDDLTTGAALTLTVGMTVDDLFDVIHTAQHAGTPIEAQYDATLGYATHIVDNGPAMAFDVGAIYGASDLETGSFLVQRLRERRPRHQLAEDRLQR